MIKRNMRITITSELTERLNTLPNLNITGMLLPDSVIKIKDLSNYQTDKDNAINHNTYIALLRDGTGIGLSCAKEQLGKLLSQIIESQD